MNIELLSIEFEKKGLVLLEGEYKGVDYPNKCIALCGCEKKLSLSNLRIDHGLYCRKCSYKNGANKRRRSLEEISKVFYDRGCLLISKEYKNDSTKLRYIAKCGHENEITYNKFNSSNQGDYCKACRMPRGENHHKYNKDLTDDDRIRNRDYYELIKWRLDVFERDNYTCMKCGKNTGGDLNAHHINGYDKFIEERTLTENGITLCKECHNDFHKQYGYGDNDSIQFYKWYTTTPR